MAYANICPKCQRSYDDHNLKGSVPTCLPEGSIRDKPIDKMYGK